MFPNRSQRHGAARSLLTVLLLAGLFGPALASSVKPPSKKKAAPASVRFIDAPSSESPAERKKRLKQACKGRPNAGACLGLTGRD